VTTRQAAILKLIAQIDQDIAEARSLSHNQLLSREERRYARASLAFYRSAAKHAERLLGRGG
jgi:hypothetical protein